MTAIRAIERDSEHAAESIFEYTTDAYDPEKGFSGKNTAWSNWADVVEYLLPHSATCRFSTGPSFKIKDEFLSTIPSKLGCQAQHAKMALSFVDNKLTELATRLQSLSQALAH